MLLLMGNIKEIVTLNKKSKENLIFTKLNLPYPQPTLICHGLPDDMLQVPPVVYSFYI